MIRTDLAMEAHELCQARGRSLSGVVVRDYDNDGVTVHCVRVETDDGAGAIGKPVGTYLTVGIKPYLRREEDAFSRHCQVLSALLRSLLPKKGSSVLVAGLGNPAITPDAVGPLTMPHILVTRHMVRSMPDRFSSFRPVSAVHPGVLGTTGVETGEILLGICQRTQPDCIIAVDALASRSADRLCTTVQLSDTGIVPGSGVGNARNALNRQTMGVPVIAIGVPTVVDAATLCADLLNDEEAGLCLPEAARGMMVTSREIDTQVADVAKLLGYSIDLALQDGLSIADLELLLS